jgi:catechol 2,3-dioxygenase-like lactoylglutathione lyase family enzyme
MRLPPGFAGGHAAGTSDLAVPRLNASQRRAMKVKRIVTNVQTTDIAAATRFYRDVLGLEVLMDMGWIATYGSSSTTTPQISFASEGGAGTPTPDLSIEVDDVDAAVSRTKDAGFAIEYGPINASWGVRRFYTRDPFGKLVNILEHKGRHRHDGEGESNE